MDEPPPFYIDDVVDIAGMIKKFTQLAGENSFTCRPQADGSIRVASKTIATYITLTQFCKDHKIAFHTYQVKGEKSFDVVINGLHKSFKIDDLKDCLREKGHIVRSAVCLQRRVYDQATERPIKVMMDKFLVHLEPAANNKEVYNIDNIDHCVVHVEQPHQRPKNGVPKVHEVSKEGAHEKLLLAGGSLC